MIGVSDDEALMIEQRVAERRQEIAFITRLRSQD
jgi:hypothetical protein